MYLVLTLRHSSFEIIIVEERILYLILRKRGSYVKSKERFKNANAWISVHA